VNSSAPTVAHVGSCLADRYDLVRHIARGGMGDVYEAVDRILHRRVAVKVFRSASPRDRERFDAEIRLLASLDHPTLVRVYDAGELGDDAYLVMELVDGPTLAAQLEQGGPLPEGQVAAIGAELAAALASIHAREVVHRDVTTSNVLCDAEGRVRLVDFGIARLLGSPRVTATSTTIGTAAFMAPEQVAGEEVTVASDVYSLGLVLLELLTGRRAFEGSPAEVAAARLVRDPDVDSGVPGPWRPLLRAMTSRAPELRPGSATVRDRLEAIAGEEPSDATAPVPVAAEVPPRGGPLDRTDPDATALIHAGGTTSVLPIPVAPLAIPDPAETTRDRTGVGRRLGWALAAGTAALLIALSLAWRGDGVDQPLDTTTTVRSEGSDTTVRRGATATAPTTVPTTVPETTLAPVTTASGFPFDGGDVPGLDKKDKEDDEGATP
jgi:tRNA A-37 threonylcarbamoyl transferase component Bud32